MGLKIARDVATHEILVFSEDDTGEVLGRDAEYLEWDISFEEFKHRINQNSPNGHAPPRVFASSPENIWSGGLDLIRDAKAQEVRQAALDEFIAQSSASNAVERLMEVVAVLYHRVKIGEDHSGQLDGLDSFFSRYQQKLGEVQAAATEEEVNAIQWNAEGGLI